MLMYDNEKDKLIFTNTSIEDVRNIINTVDAIIRVDSFVFNHEGKNYIVKNIKPVNIRVEFDFERMEEL